MLKSIIYIVVVNQERLISAVPHLYYHRRLFYRLYFTVSSAAMVFGFIFFAERLTLLSVIGLIITIGALIVISKPEKER